MSTPITTREAERVLDEIGRGGTLLGLLRAGDPYADGYVREMLAAPWSAPEARGMRCPPDAVHVEIVFADADDAREAALWAAARGDATSARAALAAWLLDGERDPAAIQQIADAACCWAARGSEYEYAIPLRIGDVVEYVSACGAQVWQYGPRVVVWRTGDDPRRRPVAHRVGVIPEYLLGVITGQDPAIRADEWDWEEARLANDLHPYAMR